MENRLKKYLILFIIVFVTIGMVGCDNKEPEVSKMKQNVNQNTIQEENKNLNTEKPNIIKEHAEEIKEREKEKEKELESIKNELSNDKMKKCVSDMEGVSYVYYIAKDKVYTKADASNGGSIIRVITPKEICVWASDRKKWSCVGNSKENYLNELSSLNQMISGQMGKMWGFKCEDITYNESIFDTSDRVGS